MGDMSVEVCELSMLRGDREYWPSLLHSVISFVTLNFLFTFRCFPRNQRIHGQLTASVHFLCLPALIAQHAQARPSLVHEMADGLGSSTVVAHLHVPRRKGLNTLF